MNAEISLADLFKKWQNLNENASDSFGAFDFSSIKKVREEQRKIEDLIYSILLENAPEDIKEILPDDCGEMEIGYNIIEKEFYYLMLDPESENEEGPSKILAITIDVNKSIRKIKNFEVE